MLPFYSFQSYLCNVFILSSPYKDTFLICMSNDFCTIFAPSSILVQSITCIRRHITFSLVSGSHLTLTFATLWITQTSIGTTKIDTPKNEHRRSLKASYSTLCHAVEPSHKQRLSTAYTFVGNLCEVP